MDWFLLLLDQAIGGALTGIAVGVGTGTGEALPTLGALATGDGLGAADAVPGGPNAATAGLGAGDALAALAAAGTGAGLGAAEVPGLALDTGAAGAGLGVAAGAPTLGALALGAALGAADATGQVTTSGLTATALGAGLGAGNTQAALATSAAGAGLGRGSVAVEEEFTLLPNAFLERPSIVWAFEWHLVSSFPITFPWTFDEEPFRFSSLDCYPGGALGDVLFEARLLDKPEVSMGASDVFGGLEQIETIKFRLAAASVARWRTSATDVLVTPLGDYPDLHRWVTDEHRGKLLVGHLLELDANGRAVGIQENAFVGETLALADDPGTVSVLARALDLASLVESVPAMRIATDWAPYAPTASLGRPVPLGIGIGRRIPLIPVKAQTPDTVRFAQTFTADAGTDRLTMADHFLETGAGPFLLSTTGTLPGGLLTTVNYWVIAVTDDEVMLATTLGNALTGVNVNLTSPGTGVQTMTGGLAPNLADDYDLIVGSGNVGIVRVWEDENTLGAADGVPDAPMTYEVQHRTYRPGGRFATSIRFQDQLDGVAVSADILRVYPDVDDAVVAEWKWLTSLRDDVGGFHALSSRYAPTVVSTGDLVQTHQRYGLGGLRLNGSQMLEVADPNAFHAQTFTCEVECIPSRNATDSRVLVAGPNYPLSWSIGHNGVNERLEVYLAFESVAAAYLFSPDGSAPRGQPLRATLVRNGSTGQTDLYLGRTLVDSITQANPLAYRLGPQLPLNLGGYSIYGFTGVLGWVRVSSIPRSARYIDQAYALWRRNPIAFCRELAGDARRLVDAERFDAATTALDAVEGGTLRADGWLLEENELRAVLGALVPFRDLRFSIGIDSRLAVDVAAPPTVIQGSFGHGDEYANLLALPTRTRASLTEAPRSIAVRFRRPRSGGVGPFGGYAMEITRPVLGVGKDAAPLELAFVDDPVTADQIADLRAKRMKTREVVVDVSLGHEARSVTRGGVIRLNVPSMAIADLTLEAVQITKGAERVAIRGVPTAAADFVYTPMPLPADPADRTLQVTDLGDAQTLQATLANGRLTLQLALSDATTIVPVRLAPEWNFFHAPPFSTIVGGAQSWECIDDPVPDDEASYIETTALGQEAFSKLSLLPPGTGLIDGIVVRARARATVGTGTLTWWLFLGDPTGTYDAYSENWSVPAGIWTDLAFALPLYINVPPPDTPWTLAQVNGLTGRLNATMLASGGGTIQVTQFFVTVYVRRESPLAAGFIRYWIRGPSASAPAPPLDTDPSQFTALDLAPQALDLPNLVLGLAGTTGDIFWVWAGVYDEFGRRIALVGPTPVVVP